MNEHGIESQETDFKLTTPSSDELPKSRIEYLEQDVIRLQVEVDELKAIVLSVHNTGK